jgi:prepilin-type N-terminal cleavage/methylation domain-containing protein
MILHSRRLRHGFTIIELLAVVVIVAVLSTIAIAKFGDSKRRAYLSAMKSDLRNIATTAESQYTSDGTYANVVAPQGSAGVTLTFAGTATGFTATATHAGVTGLVCTLNAGPGVQSEPVCQ